MQNSLDMSSSSLSKAAEEASQRYRETATMANERLEKAREGAVALSPAALEVIGTLQWVACMLINTAEEALKAKTTLARANEQHSADQLERASASVLQAQKTTEAAVAERDSVQKEMAALGGRIRKDGLSARQRQAKDAARLQALTEQATQLQANIRLSEATWAEERRAEQAAAGQRERNFQQVIVRLQQELDALKQDEASSQQETASANANAAANEEELFSLRTRVAELQSQTDHGVALIERLKARLQHGEKERAELQKREGTASALTAGLREQLRTASAEAMEAKDQLTRLRAKTKTETPKLKERHEAELQLLSAELDATTAQVKAADERSRTSAVTALAATHKLHAAEEAQRAAEAKAAELERTQAGWDTQQRSSAGAVALLRAALSESQKKLSGVTRALEQAQAELAVLRDGCYTMLPPPSSSSSSQGNGGGLPYTAAEGDALNGGSAVHAMNGGGAGGGAGGGVGGGSAIVPTACATPKVHFSMGVTPSEVTPQTMGGPLPPGALAPSAAEAGSSPAEEHAMRGLGRLRASLLDSLRAERSKLERERAMLGRA